MNKIYKWGIIGCGKIAHKFAQSLPVTANGQLWAVASRSEEKAQAFAAEYQASKYYGSYEALVLDPDLDAVYIATPHTLHTDNAILCLEGGKAVLCEKPLAINSAQVRKMMAVAEEKNVFLMEALWSRFLPHLLKIKELIQSDAIGQIKEVKADFGFTGTYDPKSRLFNPDLGGGALLDIGIYPLFLAYFLLGYPEEIQATAELAPTGVDESGRVSLGFENGARANLEFTYMEDTPIEATIIGTLGEIQIHNRWYQPSSFTLIQNRMEEKFEFDYPSNGYHYEAEEVMQCLDRGERQSQLWSLADSSQMMQLMDEIRRQCRIVYPKFDI